MQEVCKLLHIDKTRTTAYHPQSDGLVERLNRTLLSMLAATVHEHPGDWDKKLRLVCMAYNTSVHQSTGFSPFFYCLAVKRGYLSILLMGLPLWKR